MSWDGTARNVFKRNNNSCQILPLNPTCMDMDCRTCQIPLYTLMLETIDAINNLMEDEE